MGELEQESGLGGTYVRRILQCAALSPSMTETLLLGKHRPNLTLNEILRDVPLNWQKQEATTLRLYAFQIAQ
jgi:hypothetical protein